MKIRIKAEETVYYEREVELTEEEFQEFLGDLKKRKGSMHLEPDDIKVDGWNDIFDSGGIEYDNVEICRMGDDDKWRSVDIN